MIEPTFSEWGSPEPLSIPAASLIRTAAGGVLVMNSKEPNKTKVGKLNWEQIRGIAKEKMKDMNTTDLEAAARSIAGTAKSLGVDVEAP